MSNKGRPVLWQPTEKQQEFLSAPEDEVLYGGAAGGGKSDALVIDALGLQQKAITRPHYRAVLFRRSFPELRDLIDRSREIYPAVSPGAKYNESAKEWRFTSGAKIEFGYCEADKDRFRYQGRQFQYVGWDELTHWASHVPFEYLLSRTRSPDKDLACYTRATTNPGGSGHEWVRERWRIDDTGQPARFCDEIEVDGETRQIWLRFIPAKLSDNPHLSGTGYRERLMRLSPMERRALLDGRWDVVEIEGSIYGKEMEWLYLHNRVCDVPIERAVPVFTFWDLGRNDTTAIWFMQRVGLENRFVDYYENNGEGLAHYIAFLQDRARTEGYIYGEHYLPHDVEITELTTNKSRRQVLEEARVGTIVTVARIADVNEGIEMTRRAFSSCWFHRERCKRGLAALKNYRRKWNPDHQTFQAQPLHNWASNGSDAYRQFAQGFRARAEESKGGRRRRSAMAA